MHNDLSTFYQRLAGAEVSILENMILNENHMVLVSVLQCWLFFSGQRSKERCHSKAKAQRVDEACAIQTTPKWLRTAHSKCNNCLIRPRVLHPRKQHTRTAVDRGSWHSSCFASQGLLAHCSVHATKSDTATLEHQHILHPAMKSHMQLPATIPATIATATSIARGATYVSRVHLSDIWQLNFLSYIILYCPLSTCHLTYLYVAAYFSIPCNFRTLGGKLTQFDIWVLPCKVLRISWGSGRVKIFPRLQMETLCFNQLPWDSWVWPKSSRTCLKRQTPIGIMWNPHPIISKKLQKLDLNRFMLENSSFLRLLLLMSRKNMEQMVFSCL